MKNNEYDLIIVGAGPSGVFTAYELIELGLNKDKKYVTVGEHIRKNLKEVPTEEKIEGLSVEERHEKYGNDISKYIISHNARKEMTVKKVKPKINPYASEYYEDVIFR